MSKLSSKLFYTCFVLIILIISVVFLSGCEKSQEEKTATTVTASVDTTTNSTTQKNAADIGPKKWASFVASGKSYECNVSIEQDEDQNLDMIVYIKGKNLREDFVVEGEQVAVLLKDGEVYSMNSAFEQRSEELVNCDWIKFPKDESAASENFYDIDLFERAGKATVNCKQASFGDEKFAPSGKVCDFSDVTTS